MNQISKCLTIALALNSSSVVCVADADAPVQNHELSFASDNLVGVPAKENLQCNELGVGRHFAGGAFVPE